MSFKDFVTNLQLLLYAGASVLWAMSCSKNLGKKVKRSHYEYYE
jgi:hypothetical protein